MGVPLLQASCWDSYMSRESGIRCYCIGVTVISSVNMKNVVKHGWKKPLAALCPFLISSASQSDMRPEAIVVQAGLQPVTLKMLVLICLVSYISPVDT